jgi:hypothetical protein
VRELWTTGSVSVAKTGDPLLDSIVAIRETATALVEVRQHQLVQDREIKEVRGIAEQAQATATAALQTVGNHHGYMTLLGYCSITKRLIPEREAANIGRKLSAICRTRGIPIGDTLNERYGKVHTYPVSILREFFKDVVDPLSSI